MHRNIRAADRTAYCALLSLLASVLGLGVPLLSSRTVDLAMHSLSFSHVDRAAGLLPPLLLLVTVQGMRMYLRYAISAVSGGNERAPLFWLQHRIGRWLWWVEPMVHNWGVAGMIVAKLSGKKGLAVQLASSFSYLISDLLITLFSGTIYYITQSYLLSLLSSLALPALAVLPWFTRKSRRIREESARRAARRRS